MTVLCVVPEVDWTLRVHVVWRCLTRSLERCDDVANARIAITTAGAKEVIAAIDAALAKKSKSKP